MPAARVEAERATARREYESFDSHDTVLATVLTTTAFVDAATFGNRPERITIDVNPAGVFGVRFRNRGEAPTSRIDVISAGRITFPFGYEIVELQQTFTASAVFTVIAHYPTRAIDRRVSHRGPLASDVRARDTGAPEQLEPR